MSNATKMCLPAHRPEDNAATTDFLGALAESNSLCMARLDQNLRIVHANEQFRRRLLRPGDVPRGRDILGFLHPQVHTRLRIQFRRLIEGSRSWFTERIATAGQDAATVDCALTGIQCRARADGSARITVLLRLDAPPERAVPRNEQLSELSARVLEGVASGESTSDIAARLRLSHRGVEYHIGALLRRFRAPNRTALVYRSFTAGLFADESWPPRVAVRYIKDLR